MRSKYTRGQTLRVEASIPKVEPIETSDGIINVNPISYQSHKNRLVVTSEGKTEGRLLVDGSPINYEAKALLGAMAVPLPAYCFSHNRTTTCLPSSLAEITILKAVGYKAVLVGGSIKTVANETVGHIWVV